ncbi:hypothetical protein [uncultured Dokdonia sp.]|uniref:hypothetical protein n=1 Tax=uncultured Dokdonia sp. TaxID=575653 RepID=UPI00262E8AA3|nr:hypothetical protein [uncultured Dokdonia sp.]
MKSVKNLIKSLRENYYLEFLVDPNSDLVAFDKHYVLVNYQNKDYYEVDIESIKLRQQEILIDLKKEYENALSQIFLKLATSNSDTFESFIRFNIEAVKISLRTIKADFYIDSKQSRYYSNLIDNLGVNKLKIINNREVNYESYFKDSSIVEFYESLFKDSSISGLDHVFSYYSIEFHNHRMKILSRLPFALFHIASRFIIDLSRIEEKIREIRSLNQETPKIKWLGKRTHIGYVFSKLAQEGYIETPKLKNGEVNYTAFARLIKQLFEVDVSEGTLRKYLNPLDSKFEENQNTFEKENFHLPNIKLVN